MSSTRSIPADIRPTCLTVAAMVPADPRTVARVMRGERVRGHVHDRIVAALAQQNPQPLEAR